MQTTFCSLTLSNVVQNILLAGHKCLFCVKLGSYHTQLFELWVDYTEVYLTFKTWRGNSK